MRTRSPRHSQRASRATRSTTFCEVLPEVAAALGIEARAWTYAQAAAEVARLQDAYARRRLRPRAPRGTAAPEPARVPVPLLALNALGVSVVPISPDWRAHRAGISHRPQRDLRRGRRSRSAPQDLRARGAKAVLARSPSPTRAGGVISRPHRRVPREAGRAPDADTECALLYTSGTTGRPKGCVLTNEYFLARRPLVHAGRRPVRGAPGDRAHADAAADDAHERDGLLHDVHDPRRRAAWCCSIASTRAPGGRACANRVRRSCIISV